MSMILVSCGGGGSLSPKAFNDSAISIFQEANNSLNAFDAKITAGVKGGDLASIGTAADAALAEVDAKIEKLNALNAPQGAEGYKDAVLKSLEGVKTIIETGKKYSTLPEGYSKSEFNALEKEYNSNRQKLSAQLQNVAKAQKEFTAAVNAK